MARASLKAGGSMPRSSGTASCTLAIPWSVIAAIVELFVGSAALGTALSSRRLKAADRTAGISSG